ncbi:hypothetical protein FO470_05365 [Starkeya sp. 3C]|uniref:Glycosyltransferase RgtA/B/C/D-like domain-containing protein n=1 Tax=Ancylobacter moscoviensis TaxID=2597768 RepID=A0ABY3DWY7_9HYPH|nr:hypothetical protein [Ancylobacter moscoviensis]TSJ64684.1 hypothetical protein FO470_05365 [Ancylobacter moscoviensis]
MTNIHDGSSPTDIKVASWRFALLGLFLFVAGTKFLVVSKYGSIVPFWDQWDAEGALLYKPYIEGGLHWRTLIDSHNEHRILLTRLFALGLLELAGEWNPILQMTVNALLHAAFAVLFTWALGRALEPGLRLPLAIASGLLFSIPFGWENTLAGFQSQFYFLLILSFLALMIFSKDAALSLPWWLGVAACAGAYFSLASGVFAALAAASICALQIIVGARRRTLREGIGVVILVALVVAMLANIRVVEHHASLKAQSFEQFFGALYPLLFAPLKIVGVFDKLPAYGPGLLLHSPLIVFCLYSLRRPASMSSFQWLVIAVAGWGLLQMVSLAYGRAAAATAPRYLDLVIILMPLNVAALFWLATRPTVNAWLAKILSAAWFALVSIGLIYSAEGSVRSDLETKATQSERQMQNVRTYLAAGNLADLDKPFLEIPYPNYIRLGQLLADPTIRSVLPREVLPPGTPPEHFGKSATEGKMARITRLATRRALRAWPSLIGIAIALWFLSAMLGSAKDETLRPA